MAAAQSNRRQMSPTAKLWDVMSRPVQVARPGQRLAEVDAFFAAQQYSGLPVVDEEGRCVGVVSKKDMAKAPNGVSSRFFFHSLLIQLSELTWMLELLLGHTL
jgi:CBS-domain-containing membrane protein